MAGRLRRAFPSYNELANAVLRAIDLPMPEIDVCAIPSAPLAPRRINAPAGRVGRAERDCAAAPQRRGGSNSPPAAGQRLGDLLDFHSAVFRLPGEGDGEGRAAARSYASLPGSATAADHGDITSVTP